MARPAASRFSWRRLGAAVAVGAALWGASAAAGVADSPATSAAVPVDRQDYVTAAFTTNPSSGAVVDAYDGDPSSIHIAIHGGQDFAKSYIHLALSYLPTGAVASDATVTFHLTQQSDASNTGTYPVYNVNTSAAIIEACALTTELPAAFNPNTPPAYDCAHGSDVGKPNAAGDTWTFDLKDVMAYWNQHGNTGAALVAVGSGSPSQTWEVAFYKSRSAAVVSYVPPPPPGAPPAAGGSAATGGPVAPPLASGVPSNGGGSGSIVTSGPGSGAPSAGAPSAGAPGGGGTAAGGGVPAGGGAAGGGAAAVPAPSGATGTGPAAPTTVTKTSRQHIPLWPWVMAGCLAIAVIAVALANRVHLSQVGPIWRAHPRAYTVASAAVIWGLLFSGYSVVVRPKVTSVVAATSTTGSAGQPVAGGAPGATGGAALAATSTNGTVAGGQPSSRGAGGGIATATGATGGGASAPSNGAATEFTGGGTYRTINGVSVFFPANGGPPVADLFHGADDTVGISQTQIELCAHAALTYGSAFNISASDLNVYWDWLNAHGGVFGRSVHGDYQNDNYDPGTAVQAAQACKDLNTFLLLGGIGFDQIPAVRQWAEQNQELYLHHIATIENTAGLRYSFSSQPTVEQVGTWFGQLAVQQFKGKKIGILYRNSSNWSPGVDAFQKVVKAAGMTIVGSYPVTINQGNYTQELAQLNAAGAQVVWGWENALASVEMIKQAEAQNYNPAWLIFPFNLETNSLGSASLQQQLWGIATWDAYDPGYYGGLYSAYAGDIHEFEAEYKQYDSGANLSGDGGDLLFLNWEAERQLGDLLKQCGPSCTRNKIAGILLAGDSRPVPPACNVDFNHTDDHHHGGYLFNVLHVIKDPNGRPNFVPVDRCISNLP